MITKPDSFEAILALPDLNTPAKLSEALGTAYVTAQVMRHRKSIGDDHWPRLIEVLAAQGIILTTDDLLAMKHRRKQERQAVRGQDAAA